MTLSELKEVVEQLSPITTSLVMISEDKFLPLQYLDKLRERYNLIYIESLSELSSDDDIFMDEQEESSEDIYVLNTSSVEFRDEILFEKHNVLVVGSKITSEAKKLYKDILIEFPKLLEWQLRDMLYSFGKGVDTKFLDWLLHTCGDNVNRMYNEIIKLSSFPEGERKLIFNQMIDDGAFDDLTSNTIFNFTGALTKRDIGALKDVYSEIDNLDINGFGLLTILYNNFFNIVQIQLGISPTPDKLGLKLSQFNAIKYSCGKYSGEQLVKILEFLSGLDKRIKSGELPTNILRDYIVLSILSF